MKEIAAEVEIASTFPDQSLRNLPDPSLPPLAIKLTPHPPYMYDQNLADYFRATPERVLKT
jgi:hypothetical protein